MSAPQADAGLGRIRHLWFSPVRFFRARLERPPRYLAALAPLVAYTALTSAAVLVVMGKTRRVTEVAFAGLEGAALPPAWVADAIGVMSSFTAACSVFALGALAVLALDTLFVQSGRGRRLVEFTALAYWTQLPFTAVWLVIVAAWWEPAPLRLPPDAMSVELLDVLSAYQENSEGEPLPSTLRLVASYFWCWFVALQAVALRVVAGFTVGGAWAAGGLLAVLFVVAPYVVQELW